MVVRHIKHLMDSGLQSAAVADWGDLSDVEVLAVQARGDIAGLLAAFQFDLEGVDDLLFDAVAAVGVDGVGDVGVELEPAAMAVAVLVAQVAIFVETAAAVVAVAGAEVVFVAAAAAMVGELAGGHGEEQAVV